MEEEEKRDYTTLSTMQIINEPELAPTYKVETLNSHFQLLNLLELDSGKSSSLHVFLFFRDFM